ncbi:MAG: exodeoxyribonuclease VII large subunit [Gemmatimonadota bacterium]
MTPGDSPASDPALDLFSQPALSAASEDPRILTVSQVNRAVREVLEGSFGRLLVAGEVGSWTRARSGHCYFTLKDEESQLRCVLWRREAQNLPVDPQEGMRIRVHGSLTLYEARGEFQLVARSVEAEDGEGLWRLAFQRLKARLEEEGALDPSRKRRLPPFPSVVGVVTSPTAAAFQDIISVITRRAPWTRVILRGCRVQGEGAAEEIAGAMDRLSSSGLPQVIIMGRGGGSLEDLWAFNEEPVARAILRSPVPVISAVGHEVDVTISDLVADLRAATPSAAAEAAVPSGEQIREALVHQRPRLARALRRGVETRARRLDDIQVGLERAMRRRLESGRRSVHAVAGTLNALSPLATLERGYAIAQGLDGGVLRSVDGVHPGDELRLRLRDGTVNAQVQEVHHE